jgi:hypothetical protein
MSKAICLVAGCERTSAKRGWCDMHYQRWRKKGSLGSPDPILNYHHPKRCRVPGCNRSSQTRGYCGMHYQRLLSEGSPGEAAPRCDHYRDAICKIDGCSDPTQGKGLCPKHYARLRTHGDPEIRWGARSVKERLTVYVDRSGDCWLWTGPIDALGYGVCVDRDGNNRKAHRVMYREAVGEIPVNLELDHLCRNRACVNPAHLEPVSHEVNCQRGANTKLTAEQVAEIRRLLLQGRRQKALAAKYGVSHGAIKAIAAGRTWRNVPPASPTISTPLGA